MKIEKLSIQNFKKFRDCSHFTFNEQNFLVGENNTGKTSVIEAIDYLLSGPKKDKKYKNLNASDDEYISVEALVTGDFSNVDSKYQNYIFKENDVDCIKLKRSDEENEIQQSDKTVRLNESKILCWSEENSRFENPAGKDTTFNVVDVVTVYASDHVDQVVSFDSSKILGKLIKNSVGDFFETDLYKNFKNQHDAVFNTGQDSLKSRLTTLSQEISTILNEQWGKIELSFKFDLADNSSHLKKGNVLVKEGSTEHDLQDKGSGLQRSIMISMIQILSKVHLSQEDSNIILCIDEPELNLHPKAQEKLASALGKLSDNIQVIISTHSPYILKSFKKGTDVVYVFRNEDPASPKKLDTLSILPFGPTLAEIQYFAYNLAPNDLHNELYGYLKSESLLTSFLNSKKWLDDRKLRKHALDNSIAIKDIDDITKESLKGDISLQEYIRHSIHHPENKGNDNFTDEEIEQSINEMITVIQS